MSLRARLFTTPVRPPSVVVLWVAGSIFLLLLYAAVFAAFWPGASIRQAFLLAFTNVAPLAILAALVRATLKTYVMPYGVIAQAAAHLALAPAFAIIWYFAVLLLQMLSSGAGSEGARLLGFSAVALVWQAFQGLVMYALIAAVCYAVRGGREAAMVSFVEAPPSLDRYLIRMGEELVPVRVEDIASIAGAQDYSEVTTVRGKRHLVRMSLTDFAARLDARRFVRVHRSTIINLDHLDRVEPAGNGRMIAHLMGVGAIEVSRSGSQILRSFVI